MARVRRFPEHFAYLYGWYESGDDFFLAMEYFALGDLSRYLAQKIPEQQAKSITIQLLSGLHELHRIGFTHRDLKPKNVFVVAAWPPSWTVRIGDFGISKRVQENETAQRTLIGMNSYTAPEMLPWLVENDENQTYTETVDIWALGILLFRMLTLQVPFGERNPLSDYYRGKGEFPEGLLRTEITRAGIDFVKALLRPRPKDRLLCADEMHDPWLRETDVPPMASYDRFSDDAPAFGGDQMAMQRSQSSTGNPRPLESITTADMVVTVYDKRLNGLEGHGAAINAVAFSPDGNQVASASSDCTIRVWHLLRKQVQLLEGHGRPVSAVAFSPNGQLLASGSADMTLRLWDLAASTGAAAQRLRVESRVYAIAFSSDGKLVASGCLNGTIKLWDATTGAEVQKFDGHRIKVNAVAFFSNGTVLSCVVDDGTVGLWSLRTSNEIKSLSAPAGARAVALAPDGRLVAFGVEDGTIRLCEMPAGVEIKRISGKGETFRSWGLAVSPDNKLVASGAMNGTVTIWNATTGAEIEKLESNEEDWFTDLAFSPSGKVVALACQDGTVKLWELSEDTGGRGHGRRESRNFMKRLFS